MDYTWLRAEVRKQMKLQGYKTYAQLGVACGYKGQTIAAFMNGARSSPRVASALKATLKIKEDTHGKTT